MFVSPAFIFYPLMFTTDDRGGISGPVILKNQKIILDG